jgi:hypothetical protein
METGYISEKARVMRIKFNKWGVVKAKWRKQLLIF